MDKQKLLEKYLDGECSVEELHLLYQHLQKDDVEDYQDIMYKIWKEIEPSSAQPLDNTTTERIFDKVMSRIHRTIENS